MVSMVMWTGQIGQQIILKNREYRYLSPVIPDSEEDATGG